jgi:bacterioferritin-associated ferredoxin
MIVCICNNVNDATIKSAVREGATTIASVSKKTKAGSCCGKCTCKINNVIESVLCEPHHLNSAIDHHINR